MESDFLKQAKEAVLAHLSDEQFGVSELAEEVNMSRSNLLRKIKSETSLSASQFIRNIRLEQGAELLKEGKLNVSETANQVGFGSTSYFIKCYREHFGYSPGSAGKQVVDIEDNSTYEKKNHLIPFLVVLLILIVTSGYWYYVSTGTTPSPIEKSIAVLPFKNDSPDSSNVYLINGLMESTLSNLQKIRDLRVVSRTSVERFRNARLTVAEIARELPVNYLVEGSGQKVGNKIQLNIQLIETSTDRSVWSRQYNREVEDIFALQQEVASRIVTEIQAIITPEEQERLLFIPTKNIEAYELYLKGREEIRVQTADGLTAGIDYFKKALELDQEFGEAYAYLAVCYYYVDFFKADKEHTEEIKNYSDKAFLYDAHSATSMIAKGLYYMHLAKYDEAENYFLKAHEYAPGSADIVNRLSDFYTSYRPDTEKYLEFALKGLKLSLTNSDSTTNSYLYLHLSNALIQTGFVDEALYYINKSLAFKPDNPYAYLKAYILYVKNRDIVQTQNMLINEFEKDTTRVDILQEIGKVYYMERQYDKAYEIYRRFDNIRKKLGMDIYHYEHLRIGDTYIRQGHVDEGQALIQDFKNYAFRDKSEYGSLNLAGYYAYTNQKDSAQYYMEAFSEVNHFPYWVLLFIEEDPALSRISREPWFKKKIDEMRSGFWKNHEQVKARLEKENLL